ncbi:MAG: aspartate ammonia-lyase [Nitrospirae bacterium GWC2_57_13]|nr:MAG: aspartate ammonia-lyase [Nitrospirae bacterium GWC2_57_13]OGW46899.1 MAG: aspartate ammonia-lyase [Nitrospirae bacterium GWD2_57_8]HAR46156.1 aspartate ammonia-lyase [Nitrospiraceae bacterium]HAS53404.1 aspartate ammonia-lyase [Nitrospiraceae bacterium]
MPDHRIEKDSLGEVRVPAEALYGAQTQRAVENFPVSGIRFPRVFIRALGLIKQAAAEVNAELGLLDGTAARAISQAAREVAEGTWDDHFPLDIFQTGSGTSTNMNANEVIAGRAEQILGAGAAVHPNDHVNSGQSSNDVIPAAIHVSACLLARESLLPSLRHLRETITQRSKEFTDVVKTGRTHLMDAMPVRLSQELGGWAAQVELSIERIESCLPRLAKLAIGGTAVGTGVNAPPDFGKRVTVKLKDLTTFSFTEADNHFAAQASMDTALELSGHLKTSATALIKIANDLRWMNSGPIAGFGEISLPALQPGSSIMPGKVNPVICESLMMACCQVIGNDAAVTVANSHGNFELNVMLPVIAHNLLQSLTLLANSSRLLADKAFAGFTVNRERIASLLDRNPVLVTALNPVIGYDKAAAIAKKAYAEGRPVKDVAAEMTDLSKEELDRLLDPKRMTGGA